MKYKNAIFDLDGTLLDSYEGVRDSIVYAYESLGVDAPDEATLRTFLGPSLYDSFGRVSGFDEQTRHKAIALYRSVYNTENYKKTVFFDGMRALVDQLKAAGLKVSVATSKPLPIVETLFSYLDIDTLFDAVIAPDNKETSSDKTALVARAAAVGSPAVMIGDRMFDIDAARAVGVDSIGVTFGFGTKEELIACKPTYLADSAADIAAILLD